jgi:hypothetical protein
MQEACSPCCLIKLRWIGIWAQVELSRWGTLDASSAWVEFAEGVAHADIPRAVLDFGADAAVGVDWTSLPAYCALHLRMQQLGAIGPPYVFMNYR